MLLSAAVVGVIERRWVVASGWCAIAAALSATGLMHSYQWTIADTTLKLRPAWPFVIGYSAMALLFFAARWLTEEAAHKNAKCEMRNAKCRKAKTER